VRRLGPPSEIGRLAAPLARLLDGAWQRMHWWVAAMAVLYSLSGITIVKSDEVAVILRWGRLVGATPALQQHGPGLLFAFPRPVDEVVRVQVKHVSEIALITLDYYVVPESEKGEDGEGEGDEAPVVDDTTLNPLTQGYAVTGDHNIVHVNVVARYRVREPATWAFYGPLDETVLRAEVTAAMVRSLGEMGVDRVLSDGRKDLIAVAAKRAQAGLDRAGSGLEITSLELRRLVPPQALAPDFDAVQSAYIGAETRKKEAQAFAETAIPQAKGMADSGTQNARAEADASLAQARGEAQAFLALEKEYRANPAVVRERLYRDGVERALSAGNVRWVPPPTDGAYHGFRITISSGNQASTPGGGEEEER
jgi:membrane protease subunit HflK